MSEARRPAVPALPESSGGPSGYGRGAGGRRDQEKQ